MQAISVDTNAFKRWSYRNSRYLNGGWHTDSQKYHKVSTKKDTVTMGWCISLEEPHSRFHKPCTKGMSAQVPKTGIPKSFPARTLLVPSIHQSRLRVFPRICHFLPTLFGPSRLMTEQAVLPLSLSGLRLTFKEPFRPIDIGFQRVLQPAQSAH